MFSLPSAATEIILYKKPISMKWGPDRLAKLCREEMQVDPETGTIFMFFNKAQDGLKIFFVDKDGDQTLEKKLLKGAFLLPMSNDEKPFIKLRPSALPTLFKASKTSF